MAWKSSISTTDFYLVSTGKASSYSRESATIDGVAKYRTVETEVLTQVEELEGLTQSAAEGAAESSAGSYNDVQVSNSGRTIVVVNTTARKAFGANGWTATRTTTTTTVTYGSWTTES
jgi:hypothetical protein